MPTRWLLSLILVSPCWVSLPSTAQWTVAGYFGAAHTQNSALVIRQPAIGTDLRFSNVAYSGESFQAPLYYGVRGGYFFRHEWGVEAEFTHLKVFANENQQTTVTGTLNGALINSRDALNAIVQRFSISHGVNLLLANAVFRHDLWRSDNAKPGRVILDFRFGAGATIPHAESTIQGHADEHYQVGSPVIQFAPGIELRLFHRLYWMGEYKFTRVHEQVDIFSGTATTSLQSHHVVTGPTIHF
jgi:lipid A oxidase